MRGGSYDYVYMLIEEMADRLRLKGQCSCGSPALRQAFKKHLYLVAKACGAIEWNDSCDGDDKEVSLIKQCLSDGAELNEAIIRADTALAELSDVIAKAKERQA